MEFNLKNVLISDEVDSKCIDILRKNGINVTKETNLSKEDLLVKIQNYDGLIVRSSTKVTADVITAAKRLKLIGRAGTGVDNIDCDAATQKGIVVMNTPGGNTLSAAEHTCALLMSMSRHISRGTESLHAGRWDRKLLMGNEVFGKTLAIIGLGKIGKEVALRMQAFGITTIGYDPIIPAEVAAEFNTRWLPLDQIWPLADYITVHTPLIPQTRNLINEQVFTKCKRGVRVINCARGGIIDEEALLVALKNGQCGGAGLDVFCNEPNPNPELINHPLVTCTPHLGASTVEAQTKVAVEIAEQFVELASGNGLVGAINAHALQDTLNPSSKPWVELAICLGQVAKSFCDLIPGKINEISVGSYGEELNNKGSFLPAAILIGLITGTKTNGFNLINAPAFAKQNNIKVSRELKSKNEFDNTNGSVYLSIPKDQKKYSFAGSVCNKEPLLTHINNFCLSSPMKMTGTLLVCSSEKKYHDLPLILDQIRSFNSSVLSFSTLENSTESLLFLNLSHPLPSLESVKKHGFSVFQISF